jgi:DNA polymerase III subunit epsilon
LIWKPLIRGAAVEAGVTKHTTLLVVGDQDIDKLNGADKSSKHRKAETLIEKGQPIRILGEADFMSVAEPENCSTESKRGQSQ